MHPVVRVTGSETRSSPGLKLQTVDVVKDGRGDKKSDRVRAGSRYSLPYRTRTVLIRQLRSCRNTDTEKHGAKPVKISDQGQERLRERGEQVVGFPWGWGVKTKRLESGRL